MYVHRHENVNIFLDGLIKKKYFREINNYATLNVFQVCSTPLTKTRKLNGSAEIKDTCKVQMKVQYEAG